MNQDIFTDDEDRKLARESIPDLLTHNGWKLVERALDANIEYFTDKLKNRIENKRDFESLDELYFLQDRIDYLKEFKELPKTLLEEAQPEPDEEDLDIY